MKERRRKKERSIPDPEGWWWGSQSETVSYGTPENQREKVNFGAV